MNKYNYIVKLFDDIKEDIEFDSDVVTIEVLLNKMLDYDVEQSFLNWAWILKKYDILKLMNDIDFLPLLHGFPISFMKKVGYVSFFEYLNRIPLFSQKLVFDSLFNVFTSSSIFDDFISSFILNKDIKGEKDFIFFILKQSNMFSKDIFDEAKFLKKIIELHIQREYVPVSLLKPLTDYPKEKKERAILKTLLIDYIS